YGPLLASAFAECPELETWIDDMPNERYQSLFGLAAAELRDRFLDGAPAEVASYAQAMSDEALARLATDLGGHDMASLLAAYDECDRETTRPSVVFAYTVKGWGLPMAGNPRNHSALMTGEQIAALRADCGLSIDDEWDRLDPTSPAGQWMGVRAAHLERVASPAGAVAGAGGFEVPASTGFRSTKPVSTQEAFGRILVGLSRDDDVGRHLVTTAPDVATSTNLAGFINRAGVFAPTDRRQWSQDAIVKWAEGPTGQHIELGISEMNLFLLLGQLGLSYDLSDQLLLPVGTLYDPFVLRGLDAFIYSVYSGARFVVAGTPSGVSLAPEGGAHQSTITASVGLELPNVTLLEPAYGVALDWLLCAALANIVDASVAGGGKADAVGQVENGAYYFRLTTRPLDQEPFEAARARLGDATLRRQVLAGAYRLVDAGETARNADAPTVQIAASGATVPEALVAAAELEDEGIRAHVVDVTSLDRLYAAWQRTLRQGIRTATAPSIAGALRQAFDSSAPMVTVHDASSHSMAWLGSALGVPAVALGVDAFGQSGTVADLYRAHDLDSG
ncbi:MAG: transketolase-like TK C-terminal-containing protein, partial [Nocardioides sp.]